MSCPRAAPVTSVRASGGLGLNVFHCQLLEAAAGFDSDSAEPHASDEAASNSSSAIRTRRTGRSYTAALRACSSVCSAW